MYLLTISWFDPLVWCMFGLLVWDVLELFSDFGYIFRHGDINVVGWVVPFYRQSTIIASCPVDCDVVSLLKGSEEACSMVFVEIFDSKVIYSQGECS